MSQIHPVDNKVINKKQLLKILIIFYINFLSGNGMGEI